MTIKYDKVMEIKTGTAEKTKLKTSIEYNEGYDDCLNGIEKTNPYSNISYDKKIAYSQGYEAAQKTLCGATFDCD